MSILLNPALYCFGGGYSGFEYILRYINCNTYPVSYWRGTVQCRYKTVVLLPFL